ncbi:MAG TPA: hypothetical protein VEU32_21715 [Burkholderiales bacterium]|nr:hypothetical protein [Burkholderiales bacterium]
MSYRLQGRLFLTGVTGFLGGARGKGRAALNCVGPGPSTKPNIRGALTISLACAAATLAGAPCAKAANRAIIQAQASPLPPEKSPPGDIPDTQVFVEYRSPLGFSLKVPEGWARRGEPQGVSFTSAYDGVGVRMAAASGRPTAASVKRDQAAALEKSSAAVRVTKIAEVKLPAGAAVQIVFSSNSEPNPVTGKAIRLENEQYLFWKDGKLATLTLYAPYGADNADQWRLMARSFRWR